MRELARCFFSCSVLANGISCDIMVTAARFDTNISYLYQEELRGMPYAIDIARPWA